MYTTIYNSTFLLLSYAYQPIFLAKLYLQLLSLRSCSFLSLPECLSQGYPVYGRVRATTPPTRLTAPITKMITALVFILPPLTSGQIPPFPCACVCPPAPSQPAHGCAISLLEHHCIQCILHLAIRLGICGRRLVRHTRVLWIDCKTARTGP